MHLLLVLSLAMLLAWATYRFLERLGSRALGAVIARAIAWAALGLLLLDLTCAAPGRPGARPLILLDGSLSMQAAGGRWAEARDSALAWGEPRAFGDIGPLRDSLPSAGRSDLADALRAAAASDREVVVVTDGEISDLQDIAPEALDRAGVRLFPRNTGADLALGRVSGPDRVVAGDSIRLQLEVRGAGQVPESVTVEVRHAERVLARRRVRLGGGATALVRTAIPSRGLSGDVLLTLGLGPPGDSEPRDDTRLWLVRVTPTPGVVLLASPGDWDGRTLFRSLRAVAQLPIRGYVRIEAGQWRAMETLAPVPAVEVAQAARQADVLIVKGAAAELVRQARARGLWSWPSGESGETVLPGEWYPVAGPISPIAGAFLGQPVDSFPPLTQITPIEPANGEWVGLSAQLARRGADRPVMVGHDAGGRRRVTMAADGLWRWAFRGGSSEQAYRSLVATTLSWLLGGTDAAAARARPVRPVVPNGRPVVFEWAGAGLPEPLALQISSEAGPHPDTLRFDGQGRADLRLAPGSYRYRLESGGEGVIAVETWSDEWYPHPVLLAAREAEAVGRSDLTSSRRWLWLFAVAVLALAAEWLLRRRLGLR